MRGKITNFVLLIAFGCATLFSVGCSSGGSGGNNQDPNRGFYVQVTAANIPTIARVQGQFQSGSGTTTGTVTSFAPLEIGGAGFTPIPNAKVPGTWRLTYGPSIFGGSLCLTNATVDRNVSLGSFETLPCLPRFYSFTASPNIIDALAPPSSIAFTGKGISSLNGTPMLAYYNEFGYVVASTPASQLNYNGSGIVDGISVNVPDLSNAYDGEYTVAVHNVEANGTWEIIGAAPVTIYGNPPPPMPTPTPNDCFSSPPGHDQFPCEVQPQY